MSTPIDDSVAPGANSSESKRERFVRLAAKRTEHVLERLRILGNCSNRGVYEYGPEDLDKIFSAIQAELDDTRRRFEDRSKRRDEFKL